MSHKSVYINSTARAWGGNYPNFHLILPIKASHRSTLVHTYWNNFRLDILTSLASMRSENASFPLSCLHPFFSKREILLCSYYFVCLPIGGSLGLENSVDLSRLVLGITERTTFGYIWSVLTIVFREWENHHHRAKTKPGEIYVKTCLLN